MELLVFAIALTIFFVGPDLSLHLHNTWLFHSFMLETGLHLFDPFTAGGEQFVYSYGTVSYAISGVLYHFIGPISVDFVEIAMFLVIATISFYLVKDWKTRAIWLFLLGGIGFADSYANFVSFFFFAVAVYLEQRGKKRLFQLMTVIACINHPFMAPIGLLFVSRKKKLFTVSLLLIVLLQLTVLRVNFYETNTPSFITVQIIIAMWRIFVLLFPFFLIRMKPAEKLYDVMQSLRMRGRTMDAVAAGMISASIIFLLLFMPSAKAGDDIMLFYSDERFDGIPELDGVTRVIDEPYFDSIVHLPKKGVVMSNSQYFEGRETVFSGDICGYVSYLKESNISYVLIKEDTVFATVEKQLLEDNFEEMFQGNGFLIFDVSAAEELECQGHAFLTSEYDNMFSWWMSMARYNMEELSEKVNEFSYDVENLLSQNYY